MVDIFENKPEELVWIKPITTKHKAMVVITVSETQQFEIFLKDGTHVVLDFPGKLIPDFYKGIQNHTPHAHIGYSSKVKKMYRKYRQNFLAVLDEQGLYTLVGSFTF